MNLSTKHDQDKPQRIFEIDDPEEFVRGYGLYETTSQYQAYGVLKALDWHPRVEIITELFFPDHVYIVARVGTRQTSGIGKIQANPSDLTWEFAPDYWPRKLDKYDNWETGWWREVVQNARDAQAHKIEMEARLETFKDFWTGQEVEAVRVSCADDGTGMDMDLLKKAFFTWGGTDKPEGSVGGFGDAKELILLPWLGYRIHTRDTIAEGSHNRVKDMRMGSTRKGTYVTVWMPKDKATTAEYAKAFLERCNLPQIVFTVNGERIKAALGSGDLVLEKSITALTGNTSVGKLEIFHAPRSRRRGVYVRANGVFMYERPTEESKYKGVVYIEVNAPPREVFVQARNGLNSRSDAYWAIEDFMRRLTVDPRSTLKKQKADRGKVRQMYKGKTLSVNEGIAAEIAAKMSMAVPVPDMKSWKDGSVSLESDQVGAILEVLGKELGKTPTDTDTGSISGPEEQLALFTMLVIGNYDRWALHKSQQSDSIIKSVAISAANAWVRSFQNNNEDISAALEEIFHAVDGGSAIDMKWSLKDLTNAYQYIANVIGDDARTQAVDPTDYVPQNWDRIREVVRIMYNVPTISVSRPGQLTEEQFQARVAMVLLIATNYLMRHNQDRSALNVVFGDEQVMAREWDRGRVDLILRYFDRNPAAITITDVQLNELYEDLKKKFEYYGNNSWLLPANEAIDAAKKLYDFSSIKRTSVRKDSGEYDLDLKPDVGAIGAMLEDMKFVGKDHAMQALRLSAWAPQFLFVNEIDYYVPPREVGYDVKIQEVNPGLMSSSYRKLARLWSELCRFTLMRLGWSRPFGVGFIFDWDEERESSTLAAYTQEESLDFLLINPIKLTVKDKKKDVEGDVIDVKYDETKRWDISDDEALKMLCAAAVHEATHMVNGISRHDENFASAMTENMGAMFDMLVVAKKIRRALGKRTSK